MSFISHQTTMSRRVYFYIISHYAIGNGQHMGNCGLESVPCHTTLPFGKVLRLGTGCKVNLTGLICLYTVFLTIFYCMIVY